jgi:hypothetical protein
VTVICDSIMDCTRKNITNWIIADNERNTYLVDISSTSTAKAAVEVYNNFVEKIKGLKVRRGCFVHHTSDSAGVYYKARQFMKTKPDSPVTLTCGCMSHMTNLFLKDFINSVPFVAKAIQFVVDLAVIISRSTLFSTAVLKELKGLGLLKDTETTFALNIPTKTRWYSNGLTVKQGLKVKQAVQLAFVRESNKAYYKRSALIRESSETIHQEDKWNEVMETDALLSPFNFATALSELDSSTSGLISLTWIWLYLLVTKSNIVSDDAKASFKTLFWKRLKKYGEDHFFVCLLLDPRSHGVGLSPTGIRHTVSFAMKIASRVFPNSDTVALRQQLMDYILRRGVFSDHNDWVAPDHRFWEWFPEVDEISSLGNLVLQVVPHAASCE